MRLRDAIASLQLGRRKKPKTHDLSTIWSEQADDGPEAMPLPEYPRPQLVRPESEWRCLNGWWEYGVCQTLSVKRNALEDPDGKILVPFSPETKRSGVARELKPGDLIWYRRTIENVRLPEGSRLILHFGAVDERCAVYWNGHKVGNHRNGYLAFHFDVTEHVRNGDNELKVFVWDDTDKSDACRGKQALKPGGMFYHAQSGIWQTVWMEIVPEIYLTSLKITPHLKEEEVELDLAYSEELSAEAEELRFFGASEDQLEKGAVIPDEVRIFVGKHYIEEVDDEAESVYDTNLDNDIAETLVQECVVQWKERLKIRIPIPDPILWSPEHPHLYSLRIEAGDDVVCSYFAMRSFGVGEDAEGKVRLLLNGKPYFFNGILDQGYWPESLMTAPADEAFVHDITRMKKAGFNTLRKHVKIEAARWYYHCDRIGMVVWQDMVNGGSPVNKLLETYLPTVIPAAGQVIKDDQYELLGREDEASRQRFERDLMRMIRQLYNCPCIGLWTLFNEGWGQFDALRLANAARRADPTRSVDHASGWFDQGGGDVRSVHNYFRSLEVEKDDKMFANIMNLGLNSNEMGLRERAFVISEYGGANCRIEGHVMSDEEYGYSNVSPADFPKAFEDAMANVKALVKEGLSGAVYTQVSDIEEETNGLMTYDRKVSKL
ncbi:MAG: glycoside hydrolase family 2 TIM barrel-domain containing protein [Lachnospiraceae bacterium]|nr:glycoside hydrolase family 2 TIM barrel-domain containing protein [Lachnospiraceae bacterium]